MRNVAKRNNQKGLSLIYIIIGVVVILIIGYIGIQPGGFFSKSIFQNAPSRTTVIPVDQWLTFQSTDPKFSVKYPSDWVYQKRGESNTDNLIALSFTHQGNSTEATANSVTLRVLDRKNAPTLQDWVNKYTTHLLQDDTAVTGKGYVLYKVASITNAKVGDRDVIKYSTDTIAAGKADGTIIASDKHIFVFLGLSGKAEDTRNKMISSLSF